MSFCKEKKIGCFCNRPFWQGQKDSFSSLDARRSGRLYRAKGHGIHCRPILVLLQEANKKIGCFRNRPFWQGQKDSFSSLDARRSGRLYRAKGHGIHCRPILVLLQEANKKIGCFCNRPFGRGRRTLSPRSTLVGQDGSTVPKGTVFTAILFSSFCKKQRKKSAAFATDLFGRAIHSISEHFEMLIFEKERLFFVML